MKPPLINDLRYFCNHLPCAGIIGICHIWFVWCWRWTPRFLKDQASTLAYALTSPVSSFSSVRCAQGFMCGCMLWCTCGHQRTSHTCPHLWLFSCPLLHTQRQLVQKLLEGLPSLSPTLWQKHWNYGPSFMWVLGLQGQVLSPFAMI